jgi:hypothetical protein
MPCQLPSTPGSLSQLTDLDLSENVLSEPVPSGYGIPLNFTGNSLELHLSPRASNFAGINLLGGSAFSVANIISNNRKNKFYMEFNEA